MKLLMQATVDYAPNGMRIVRVTSIELPGIEGVYHLTANSDKDAVYEAFRQFAEQHDKGNTHVSGAISAVYPPN